MQFLRNLQPVLVAPLRHRTLFVKFTQREVAQRYHGSLMGFAWAFLNPLMMSLIYSFMFIGVFRMKWPGTENATGPAYALRLFCGLVIFNLFAEVLSRAPSLISNHPNLVKKVQFSLELLSFLLVFSFIFEQPSMEALYVPVVRFRFPF